MSADWDEIKRLAADFQKVQLSSTLQKLSERNCVEIVSLLIEKQLIDVIFTNDGKEYITSGHLETEILDELYIRGGRVNTVELSKVLNVDLSRIDRIAETIAKEQTDTYFLLGQLIDENYVQRIASEINEKLSQNGEISVSDLTVQFDLPSDFILKNVMEKYIGSIIQGKQDPKDERFFFTKTYISRCRAKLRGALSAITRPTPVSAILAQCGVKDRIFYSLFDEASTRGTLTSKSPGAQYIPHIYTKTQTEWIHNIYNREGYLEHDKVLELGVSDPKSFIQRQLPKEKLTHLKKCTIGQRIIDQIESEIEECISSNKFLDVTTVLPSVMTDADITELMDIVLDPIKQKTIIRFDTKILTKQYIDDLIKPCYAIVDDNAKKSVESGKYQQYVAEKMLSSHKKDHYDNDDGKQDKREERRKKASGGKVGGGTQGRETKTKSTKKHNRTFKGNEKEHSDSDDEYTSSGGKSKASDNLLELISIKDIIKIITPSLENEELDGLTKQIAQLYYLQLNKYGLTVAQNMFEATLQNNSQSRRQTHAMLQEKLNVFFNDIRLYEKGLKCLPTDTQTQLVKYLLKSLGSDICNEISLYVANECGLNYSEPTLTAEQRTKIQQDCTIEYGPTLVALNKALNGASIEEFLSAAETALITCSMILKKIDKKKDRVLIHSHKLKLLDELGQTNDPPLVLHLTVLIIFTVATQNMLHASGRHVSTILSYLQSSLQEDQSKLLTNFHDLVLKVLSAPADSDEIKEAVAELNNLIPLVKDIAKNFKKAGTTNVE